MNTPKPFRLRLTLDETASRVVLELAEERGQSPERIASEAARFLGVALFLQGRVHGVVRPVGDPREEA